MDLYMAMKQGGLVCLRQDALPALSASALLFVNPPKRTRMVSITVLDQNIYVRWDGGTAVAGDGGGELLEAGGNYAYPIGYSRLLGVNAIEGAASAAGTISYWALAGEELGQEPEDVALAAEGERA